jgi:hypothetical protein
MPQLGEPYNWGNPWDGTEFEDIINELIEKVDNITTEVNILKEESEGLRHDFESFKNSTIKMVTDIFKKLHEQ